MIRAILLLLAAASLHAQDLYIRAGRLFDGRSDTIRENVVIVVRGTTIADVGNIMIPDGAQVIDLHNRTVMPGLIDAHTHIALHPGDYDAQILRETPELRAIHATVAARKTLEAGITTIRDLGNEGAGFADLAVRDAVAKGIIPGPRVVAAIRPITSTGAYRLTGYSPYVTTPPLASAADGVGDVRKEVRTLIAQGADVIKIYMESYEKRELRPDLLTGAMNYSEEELRALVEEAHRAGARVAAHTYSDAAAKLAIAVGVDSIEHGLYLSDETFRTMAAKGIWYVPTLYVYELWRDENLFGPLSPAAKTKLTNTVTEHTATFRRALASGVKIAFGSDTFEHPGTNAHELVRMAQLGMKPIDVLRAATSTAADLLGLANVTGTIERGKAADIIALDGDPLRDPANLERVVFVMKDGQVHKR